MHRSVLHSSVRVGAGELRALARLERQLLCTVKDREHVDSIGEDAVDDTVRRFVHLTDVLALKLRNHSPRHRELRNLLRSARQTVHNPERIPLGVERNVVMDRCQLLLGVVGPVNSHSGSP